MRIKSNIRCTLLFFLPLLALTGFAEPMKIIRLSQTMIIAQVGTDESAGRIFALNSDRGIVVIDTSSSPQTMQEAKDLIEAEFKRRDYAFVINSHDHVEHIGGNALFPAQIIVGQEGMIDGIAHFNAAKSELVDPLKKALAKEEAILATAERDTAVFRTSTEKIAKFHATLATWEAGLVCPTILFRDRLTLNLGNRTIQLISCGGVHSYSDCLIYFPEEKVLLTGGVCSKRKFPPGFPGNTRTMDVEKWLSALSEFADTNQELKYVIPGHPSYLTKADLKFIRDYYRTLWQGFNQAKKDGLTLEQVKQRYSLGTGFGDFPSLANPTNKTTQQHEKNMEALWAFLDRPAEALRTK
jgi:glyoxylase-like metal-dependent hydrolase (beta-lactamase superfamily II)